jgi:hypothetical protein
MNIVTAEQMKDTTLLIQGPLKEDTYRFYCKFYATVPKVFSTWKENRLSNNWRLNSHLHSESDEFIESEVPKKTGHGSLRMHLESVLTLAGLDRVKTNYVLRLRGDEWYSNLWRVSDVVRHDKEGKIFMLPIFLKKWHVWPARMSDHMLAGLKQDIKLMYDSCLIGYDWENVFGDCWPLPYQGLLALGYLKKKTGCVSDPKNEFLKMFELIGLDDLKYYKVSSDSGNRCWYSNFNPVVNSMSDI